MLIGSLGLLIQTLKSISLKTQDFQRDKSCRFIDIFLTRTACLSTNIELRMSTSPNSNSHHLMEGTIDFKTSSRSQVKPWLALIALNNLEVIVLMKTARFLIVILSHLLFRIPMTKAQL